MIKKKSDERLNVNGKRQEKEGLKKRRERRQLRATNEAVAGWESSARICD